MTDVTELKKEEKTAADKVVTNIYDVVSVFATSLIIIALLFTFVFRVVGVVGESMVPTLQDQDWLIVSPYDRDPDYGQVIIITQPNGFNEPIVKRIIATENQVLDIDFATGTVTVDGRVLDEPYINNATTNDEGAFEYPLTVPEGKVFVMGDNRQNSSDSRSPAVGFIDENYILGVVKYRMLEKDVLTGRTKLVPSGERKVSDLK